jgi:hypothetical protein
MLADGRSGGLGGKEGASLDPGPTDILSRNLKLAFAAERQTHQGQQLASDLDGDRMGHHRTRIGRKGFADHVANLIDADDGAEAFEQQLVRIGVPYADDGG